MTQHHLPIMLGSFVGREQEQAEVLRLVLEHGIRIVTLTGPGGVGKTRLAVQVARQLGDHFHGGVVFVSLAPVADPGLVPSAIAHALDVREVRNIPLLRTLQVHLQRRAVLLILDNFEHVVAAAPVVADLLTSCARLHVVVTSRAPLHIRGEYEVAIPPLGLPESNASSAPEELLGTDAARLLYERARAIRADFAITRGNAAAVAEICRRLDGLPLAIELAAARVKILPPAALLAHLQRRLPILTGGTRDSPARQQTLRETIGWSYHLLERSQQQLFRRLTVFVGGCTLSSVAAVCLDDGDAPDEVLDLVAALVDQSLLKQVESANPEPRYRLLETIREYGLEQLAASGEVEMLARRHADYFLALAEDAEAGLAGASWRTWRRELHAERENLRAALDWAVAWGEADIALRLVGSLWRWFRPDAIAEGRRWIEQPLALPGGAVQPRAKALFAFGVVAMQQGDYRVAASAWKESIGIWRALGDLPRLADTLMFLASIYRPDARAVPVLLDESIALARQVGAPRQLALALGFLGWQVLQSVGPDAARPLLAEALPLARMPGDPWELIWVLYVSGLLSVREGEEETARHRFAEALELAREARDHMMAALALAANGRAALVDVRGRMSYATLQAKADRCALGLLALGIRRGDVVTAQLPNWNEFVVLTLALERIGAVINPVAPIFRQRELRVMLRLAGSVAAVIPASFRGWDFAEMYADLQADAPALKHLVVIDGDADGRADGILSWSQLLARGAATSANREALDWLRPDPDDITSLLFTSGTTGEPKGVMHTANTLGAIVEAMIARLQLTHGDVFHMASTVGHMTGYEMGVRLPLYLGARAVYQDIWDAEEFIRLIEAERVTFTLGATPFLADTLRASNLARHDIRSLRQFVCGGAPIPRTLATQAVTHLSCQLVPCWGMTEVGPATMTHPDDPMERVVTTDGCVYPQMELTVRDPHGSACAPGQEGDLYTRGAFAFAGYLQGRRFTQQFFTPDGWFATGDRGVLDTAGYVRITGRSKDIIIRAGENIPVKEIEDVLLQHPKLRSVALVGLPDARLGELACACIIPEPGATLTLPELRTFLAAQQVTRQFWPERLQVMDAFPMTPSGKVQKFQLRQMLAAPETAEALVRSATAAPAR